MKKTLYNFLLLVSIAGLFSSCREQSKIPQPAIESVPLIFPAITADKSYFDYTAARASVASNPVRPVFEFTVNPTKVDGAEIQIVEVYKSFRRDNILGPRVKVTDLTNFPATVTINSQEALTGLRRTNATGSTVVAANANGVNQIFNANTNGPRDYVVFTFEYVLKDGRRIVLTPLTTDPTGSGTVVTGVATGNQTAAPYAALAAIR